MDGFLFYWVFWLIIIAIFFFDDIKERRRHRLYLCFVIILSSMLTIQLPIISIRLSFILFTILAFYFLTRVSKKNYIYSYILSTIISGIYVLFLYFVYFEPVWLYLSPKTMITGLSFVTVIVLINNHTRRLSILVAGIIQGEMILTLLLYDQIHPILQTYIMGNFDSLDIIALCIFLVVIWNYLEYVTTTFKNGWFKKRFGAQTNPRKLNA